jgi:hypothetical protein
VLAEPIEGALPFTGPFSHRSFQEPAHGHHPGQGAGEQQEKQWVDHEANHRKSDRDDDRRQQGPQDRVRHEIQPLGVLNDDAVQLAQAAPIEERPRALLELL